MIKKSEISLTLSPHQYHKLSDLESVLWWWSS